MGHKDGLTIILYILKLISSADTCPHKDACSSATARYRRRLLRGSGNVINPTHLVDKNVKCSIQITRPSLLIN